MPADLPLSVWPTAQQTARTQRAGRYIEISGHHPAKMLPAIAQRAIVTYTKPGDLVADPMCGIGSTLVEAVHLGRDAIGVEYEPQWTDLARANVAYARSQGATGHGEVVCGDARHLTGVVDPAVRSLVALVLTSPPYGPSLHGQVTARPGRGIVKSHDRYSTDPANLARRPHRAARRHADHPRRLRRPAPPRRLPGHDRPPLVARRPAHRPARRSRPSRRRSWPRPLRTQRRPSRRPSRRPARAPHLVLRARSGPQGPPTRRSPSRHRPRGLPGLQGPCLWGSGRTSEPSAAAPPGGGHDPRRRGMRRDEPRTRFAHGPFRPIGTLPAEALTSPAEVWPPPVDRRPPCRRKAEAPCGSRSRPASMRARAPLVAGVGADG